MNIHMIKKTAVALWAAASMCWSAAASVSGITVDGARWHMKPAAEFISGLEDTGKRNESLLAWGDKGGEMKNSDGLSRATGVLLVVAAPLDAARPVIEKVLAPFGKFWFDSKVRTLSDLAPGEESNRGWAEILSSRQADLRNKSKQTIEWFAIGGDRSSEISVFAADITTLFGRPATVVQLRRYDEYSSADRDPHRGFVVPASVFLAVHDALSKLGKVEIGRGPTAWFRQFGITKTGDYSKTDARTPSQRATEDLELMNAWFGHFRTTFAEAMASPLVYQRKELPKLQKIKSTIATLSLKTPCLAAVNQTRLEAVTLAIDWFAANIAGDGEGGDDRLVHAGKAIEKAEAALKKCA